MSHPLSQSVLIDSQQAALSHVQAVFELGLNGLEKWSSLHVERARQSAGLWFEHSRQLANSDPAEIAARHATLTRTQLENLSADLHQWLTLSLELQSALQRQAELAQQEWNRTLSSSLDWYAGSGQGTTLTVNALKSAISAANTAFDQASKSVRQVADIAEASVSAASSATLRATASTPASRKKAA